jgi:uncharacterized protein
MTIMLNRLAALAFSAAISLPGRAADLPSYPFIHVSASSEVHLMPDTGELDIDIVSHDPDPDAAWKLVTDRLEAARALFARHGIAPDDVSVQDIVRRPRKTELQPNDEPAPMETRVALHVTVRDLAPWTDMLRTLLATKDIESLAVSFSRSDREQVEADLATQALGTARRKAQNIARAIGAKLGPATGVALTPLKNLSNAMGMATEPASRYTGARNGEAPDRALIQSMRLMQAADVIYRIAR